MKLYTTGNGIMIHGASRQHILEMEKHVIADMKTYVGNFCGNDRNNKARDSRASQT